jgi:thiamine pyrophosphate-dependent acetolactate synthase large subunit-like protein
MSENDANSNTDEATAKADEATEGSSRLPSRRQFLLSAAPAAAAAAGAAAFAPGKLMAQGAPSIPSIKIPKELGESMSEAPFVGKFEGNGMTGAEIFAQLCVKENLAAMFCCPGNYTVTHAVAAAGIPSYGGRTEGSMAAAADGYSRATGEVVACSGTEGPGFTHMIMPISAAYFARTPLLVLASNVQLAGEDREAGIQAMYQQPLTTGIKKYGKRMIIPNRVHEYGGYAFRQLKTDIPGPVHLDFPGEVARARFNDPGLLTDYYDKSKYRSESRSAPAAADVAKAVELIGKAERPLLIAGHGVFHRQAWDATRIAAEKNELAVCTSGPMRGHFPDDHRLSASLSPRALMSADLIIFVGQYTMPSPSDYRVNPDIRTIRVNPIGEDLGRNWALDLGIVSDELAFLEALGSALPRRKRDAWVAELASARQTYEKELDGYAQKGAGYTVKTGTVHPAVIGHELHQFLYKGKIDPLQTVTGWGGFTCQRFVTPMLRANRPGQEIVCPYQFGAIGPDLAMMVGAAMAVKDGRGPQAKYKGAPTLVMTTDAGMGYGLLELDTAVKYKIPLIAVVYNNNAWGTWPFAEGSPRSLHLHLFQENLRYDKMAEAMGAHGVYVQTQAQLRDALTASFDIASRQGLPSLINVQACKEYSSPRDYPPGAGMGAEPGISGFMH